ncbi:sulfotransferase family 2 domain-containing protein [Pleomorphovibrio marinus]|uniref:sulfotransferase family 2 domain-containing protein n=1 Tax=Pleomorphovibrio marinus TaxID=2164132 RepID=UPI000E0AB612|nr:sulfotransferase family 2 domain-containing protein [Pleomorphovibrio marinus]
MIISHEHKFVFVCLPRTGTTAIRKELCEQYGGTPILYKHASYDVFLRQANKAEKNYRVIASVRNPMDRTVSLYFKYLSNHDQIQQGQIKEIGDKNLFQRSLLFLANKILAKRASAVASGGLDFATFFLKFYSTPYSDWHFLYWDRYDQIVRFEHLSDDFHQALENMGIIPKRPLPIVNRTKKENKPFWEYYRGLEQEAVNTFDMAFRKFGYSFPPHYPSPNWSNMDSIRHRVSFRLKKFYWKYIR